MYWSDLIDTAQAAYFEWGSYNSLHECGWNISTWYINIHLNSAPVRVQINPTIFTGKWQLWGILLAKLLHPEFSPSASHSPPTTGNFLSTVTAPHTQRGLTAEGHLRGYDSVIYIHFNNNVLKLFHQLLDSAQEAPSTAKDIHRTLSNRDTLANWT